MKRPVNAVSLLDTKEMLLARIAKEHRVSIEAQDAIKVFHQFDIAFELTATKRLKDEALPKLLQSMRQANSAAGQRLPEDLYKLLKGREIQDKQTKQHKHQMACLQNAKFQCGRAIGQYHQTVVRLFYCRAKRDARRLRVPLHWCQAAGDTKGLAQVRHTNPGNKADFEKQVRRSLFRSYNYNETAHLMILLPAHIGMRVRLTEKLSPEHSLVQEAEGTIVDIVPDPQEDPNDIGEEILL